MFEIAEGYVTASTFDDDGKKRIHLIYGPGSYFPVLTTFSGGEQRATYEALTVVTVTKRSRENFLELLDNDAKFCRAILAKTVDQLTLFADRVIDLQMTKLIDQLQLKLSMLAKDHGRLRNGYTRLPYKLKHHHIADMLGVERESISRALGKLKSQGFLRISKDGYIEIRA